MKSSLCGIYIRITKIISVFERKGSIIKQCRKPERNDVNETLLKWLKQQRIDTVPVSGPLLTVIFVFSKF